MGYIRVHVGSEESTVGSTVVNKVEGMNVAGLMKIVCRKRGVDMQNYLVTLPSPDDWNVLGLEVGQRMA